MSAFLLAPETLWLAAYLLARRIAASNTAPDFRWNNALFPFSVLVPVVAVAAIFAVHFGLRTETASWGLLFRCALTGVVGATAICITLLAAVGGSGSPGAPMGLFVALPLILLTVGGATVVAGIRLIRMGQAASFAGAAWKLTACAAVLTGLFALAQWLTDRRLAATSGEHKAIALSRAYGDSIGAKSAGDWTAEGKRWGKYFTLQFAPPNSIRIVIETNYTEFAQVGDPERTLRAWRGWIGEALQRYAGGRRTWEPRWDDGMLVWSTGIEMSGLTRREFLEDTAAARRFATGSFGDQAPQPMWWLYRDPMEAALLEPSRERQAMRWTAESLRQAQDYYRRVAVSGEGASRLRDAAVRDMGQLSEQAMQLSAQQLRDRLKQFIDGQRPEQITGVQDAFLVKGALQHLEVAMWLLSEAAAPVSRRGH